MAETYQIKKGDTLGAIASKFGTTVDNISGFKSGNPDLIFPGETITIGASTPKVSTPATDRAGSIRSEFSTTVPDTTIDKPETEVNRYQTDLDKARTDREGAFKKLEGFRTTRYDELREERGLENSRTAIDKLDADIAQKKSERDASLAKVKKNPGASAATITGDVANITEQLNAEINNLIEQRNSQANSYNSSVSEIDTIVSREAGDLESELDFYTKSETGASGALEAFNKSVLEELRRTEDRGYAEEESLLEFERALEIARIKGTGSDSGTTFQLKFDPITGESFLFNPDTGQVVSPEEAEVDESSTVVNQSLLPVTQQSTSGGNFLSGIGGFLTDLFKGE